MNYDTKLDEIIDLINLKTIEIQKLDNDIESKKKMIIDLGIEQSFSEGKLLNTKQEITREESIKIDLQSKNASLDESLHRKKIELEMLDQTINTKRNDINVEISSLEASFNKSEAKKNEILSHIESKINQAKNDLNEIKSQIMTLDNSKINSEKEIKVLEATKSDLEIAVLKLKEDNDYFKKLVLEKHTNIKFCELQLDQTKEQIEKLRKDIIVANENLATLNELKNAAKYETEQFVKQKIDLFKLQETLNIRESYIKGKFVQAGIPYK